MLFEGYLLYPYRASAQKNQVRWQWGVLVPQGYGADSGETSANRTECLVELRGDDPELHVRVRYLHLERRTVLDAGRPSAAALEVGDGAGSCRSTRACPGTSRPRSPGPSCWPAPRCRSAKPGGETVEQHPGGRVVRTRLPLTATATLRATEPPGPYDVLKLTVEIRNDAAGDPTAARDDALRRALIGTHLMLAADPGAFVSPTDPPQWAAPYLAQCRSEHAWPVLAGPQDRSDLLLSAPIILADHPRIAPESTINLFDGTENDEILTLRTMVLTDAEKAEARSTDPRAAAIIDAVDGLPPEILERLHGAIRSLRPVVRPRARRSTPRSAPTHPTSPRRRRRRGGTRAPTPRSIRRPTRCWSAGVPVAKGSAVVLRPRRAGRATPPTPRTHSWPGCGPPFRRWCTTSTAQCTWPSRWTGTRPPSCSWRTAGSATSGPTSWRCR